MPNKTRKKWQRPFNWPPSTWEFTPGLQFASEVILWVIFTLIIVTILSAIIIWPMLIARTLQNIATGSSDDVRNTLLAVAALIGVPFLIWRTLIAARQTDISREGHYTALFTKAVEQLGADKVVKKRDFKPHFERDLQGNLVKDPKGNAIPKLSETGEASGEFAVYEVTSKNYEVRLGAIYALERIAQDSARDAWPIYLTLCSYVENNAAPRNDDFAKSNNPAANHSDIEEIFNVLDRFRGEREAGVMVQFSDIHIPALRLLSGGLSQVTFSKCSIGAVTVRGGLNVVFFEECISELFDIRQAEVFGFVLRQGQFKEIVVNDCSLKDFHVKTSSDRAMLLSSEFWDGRIQLESREMLVAESRFENVTFGERVSYNPRPLHLTKSEFLDCRFIEMNFYGVDFSSSNFTSCRFERCNFVRSVGLKLVGNELIDSFTDTEYVPGASSNSLDLDLNFQWSAWIRKHL